MTAPDPITLDPAAPVVPAEKPPWGEEKDFDAEKAWNLIQNLRGDVEKLKGRTVLDDDAKTKLAEYDKLKAASQTELEKANESLTRWQTEAEQWRGAAVGSKIQALAAADFADPSDAVTALSGQNYLDAGGQIDEAAIKADLTKTLDAKPHWRRAAEPTAPRVPAPNTAQGRSGAALSTDPAQQFGAVISEALAR
jgi:hypothetical protein